MRLLGLGDPLPPPPPREDMIREEKRVDASIERALRAAEDLSERQRSINRMTDAFWHARDRIGSVDPPP